MFDIILFFSIIVLLLSMIIHEIAHGSMALALGDPTAKDSGRLTLNPLRHLDPIGSILLPLLLIIITQGQGPIFGWTKPVPVNPYNFRDRKWGILKVAIAGPTMNFLIAIVFGLMIRFFSLPASLLILFSVIVVYNLAWGIFNLVPIPPLDGSHILFTFLSEKFRNFKIFLHQYGFLILFFLIFTGLLNWISPLAMFLYSLISGHPFSF